MRQGSVSAASRRASTAPSNWRSRVVNQATRPRQAGPPLRTTCVSGGSSVAPAGRYGPCRGMRRNGCRAMATLVRNRQGADPPRSARTMTVPSAGVTACRWAHRPSQCGRQAPLTVAGMYGPRRRDGDAADDDPEGADGTALSQRRGIHGQRARAAIGGRRHPPRVVCIPAPHRSCGRQCAPRHAGIESASGRVAGTARPTGRRRSSDHNAAPTRRRNATAPTPAAVVR